MPCREMLRLPKPAQTPFPTQYTGRPLAQPQYNDQPASPPRIPIRTVVSFAKVSSKSALSFHRSFPLISSHLTAWRRAILLLAPRVTITLAWMHMRRLGDARIDTPSSTVPLKDRRCGARRSAPPLVGHEFSSSLKKPALVTGFFPSVIGLLQSGHRRELLRSFPGGHPGVCRIILRSGSRANA
jgi:hypothetical protein